MIDDVRPFIVDSSGEWTWAGNVGGGDFQVVTETIGELVSEYPLTIATEEGVVAASFQLAGGVGYTPIVFLGLQRHDGWVVEKENDDQSWSVLDQAVEHNDYWQKSI